MWVWAVPDSNRIMDADHSTSNRSHWKQPPTGGF